ncbi:hypothetical protein [Lacrimispora sp. 210928-DFI.3.58]|uniref:hypothetical protein n=1 Tax=Lacrimispora sp. 210928-DFI.3.58 TaxID=2883214 RepID=UPI001D088CAD|nr:hypothetical protein [Lacrimispora sp. 210928-DFI.3.58]MCB7321295.1 hypothetical protein [Lacrimispora sp. 210928-DFI.3.58]
MKVREMQIGNCTVEFHNDYIVKTEEERQAILKHLSIIVSSSLAQKEKMETA